MSRTRTTTRHPIVRPHPSPPVQNDWHVRLLGPGGIVHNITELKPGSAVLGHIAAASRHVGMAVDEYCLEK